ncbi:MAG: hypothetical protein HOQ24_13350, partial [Mycobacteriaceae bacterium]|nr:hypothetical protein [Mycobacteriaceae bacterium]
MQREHAGFAYPAAEVQAVVARALDGGVGHESMIRRAAAGLAAVCRDELDRRGGGVYGRRVALLVGSGHNGADAL